MRPAVVSKTLAAADANGICESQTPLAGGSLDLDGVLVTDGVATLDTWRRILITTVGNESARTFTITGTNSIGVTITEDVPGPNATTAYTTLDFATVTDVSVDDATADALTVGTNEVGSTNWVPVSTEIPYSKISVACVVSGTINFTVQVTYDNVSLTTPGTAGAPIPTTWNVSALASKSANTAADIENVITAWRVTQNSGTGTVTATGIQAGMLG